MLIRSIALVAALASLAPTPAASHITQPWPEVSADCSGLADALRNGATIVCLAPAERGFVAEHRFRCDDNAPCIYTRTLPGNLTVWCRFSQEGREAFAASVEAQANGPISGAAARECEVRDGEGAVVPWERAFESEAGH